MSTKRFQAAVVGTIVGAGCLVGRIASTLWALNNGKNLLYPIMTSLIGCALLQNSAPPLSEEMGQ